MTKITLLATASSRDEPYKVTFTFRDGALSIWCDCRAGEFGQLCKHKRGLASNDQSMLYEKSQLEKLSQANEWVQTTDFAEMIRKIIETEKEIEEAKKRLKNAKAKLARQMQDGIK